MGAEAENPTLTVALRLPAQTDYRACLATSMTGSRRDLRPEHNYRMS